MWDTVGHEKIVSALRSALKEGRVSHAYLLTGPRQGGKMMLAMELAKAVNCLGVEAPCGECRQCRRIARGLHADVQVVGLDAGDSGDAPSRVLLGIDQVRDVQREVSLKPYEGTYRVVIFDGAERLSDEAANSLLKTLEEPPDQVILLLLTTDRRALLPTIVSRCQLLELRHVPRDVISRELVARYGLDETRADAIARLSEGRPGWAIEAATRSEVLDKLTQVLQAIETTVASGLEQRFAYAERLALAFARNRDSVRQELAYWVAWWRDVMLVKEEATGYVTHISSLETLRQVADAISLAQAVRAISAVHEAVEHLERNVNPRLALEELMLALPRP